MSALYPISDKKVTAIAAQSMGSSIASASIYIGEALSVGAQFTWSGTSPSGTAQIYGSNDNVNFGPIQGAQTITIASNSGTACINLSPLGVAYIQAIYTFTSGTGTLTSIVNVKSI
jgi:hypothetical protein